MSSYDAAYGVQAYLGIKVKLASIIANLDLNNAYILRRFHLFRIFQYRQRVQHLVEQTEEIEHSIKHRLQQHSLNTKTIADDQEHIRQQYYFDKQIISGVRPEKQINPSTKQQPVCTIPTIYAVLNSI